MSCKDCHTVSPLYVPEIDLLLPFGTTPIIKYTGKNVDETPFDFDGKEFDFRVYKNKRESTDPEKAIFTYETAKVTITDDADGVAAGVSNVLRLLLEQAEIDLMSFDRQYYYRWIMKQATPQGDLGLMKGQIEREGG